MLTTSCLLSSVICFFAVRFLFKQPIKNFLKDQAHMSTLMQMSKKSPWKSAFLIRFTFVSPCYKNYFSAIASIKFIHFIIFNLFHTSITTFFDTQIGRGLKNLEDINSYNVFENPLFTMATLFYFGSITFTIVMFCFLGKKTIEKVQSEQNSEANPKDVGLQDEEEGNYCDNDQAEMVTTAGDV